MGKFSENAVYSALGPLRIFTEALGGKEKFLSTIRSFSDAFGSKKVNTPTESELISKGGNIGKGFAYVGRKIDKMEVSSGKESTFDNVKEGIAQGIGASVLGDFVNKITLPKLVGAGFLGVGIYAIGDVVKNVIGREFETAANNALNAATTITPEMLDSNSDGIVTENELSDWTNKLFNTFVSWDDQLGSFFAEGPNGTRELTGKTRDEIYNILKGSLSPEQQASLEDSNKTHDNYLMMLLLAEMLKNPTGYTLTTTGGSSYDVTSVINKLQDTFKTMYPDDAAINGLGGFGPAFYDEELLKKYDIFTNGGFSLTDEGLEAFTIRIAGLANELGMTPTQSIIRLDDAIIYKDNSLYVPHPDDNIVLTKDEISTPVLSNSFESNLFNMLEELLSKKSSGASVVSIQSAKPQIDFSLLRI